VRCCISAQQQRTEVLKDAIKLNQRTNSKAQDALQNVKTVALFGNRDMEVRAEGLENMGVWGRKGWSLASHLELRSV
jgi:predicted transport protein